MFRRLTRALAPAVLVAALLAVKLGAATSATMPVPASSRGIGLLGQVTAVSDGVLVLNDGRQAHSIRLGPATRLPAGLPKVGAAAFVGAEYSGGGLVARVVQDLSGVRVRQDAMKKLAAVLDRTPAKYSQSSGQPDPTCQIVFGFLPTTDMINFDGCTDAPNLTIAPDFQPIALVSIPGFEWDLTSFDVSLSLSGGYYEFPFKFTAVDVASRAFDGWVSQCITDGYTVNNCPYARPPQPAPGQPRQVEINVTPVRTAPVPSYQWGTGAYLSMGFHFVTPVGCGSVGLSPCTYDVNVPVPAPLSSFSQTREAPPLAPGSQLAVPAVSCASVGVSLVLPPIIGGFMSPFDVQLCHYLYIDPPDGGFQMNVEAGGQDVVDLGQFSFDGTPRVVSVTPRTFDNGADFTFSDFHYTATRHFKEQLRFRTFGGNWIGTPLLSDVTTSQTYASTPPLYDHPDHIQVNLQYAPIASTTVGDYAPQAVDADGGSVIHVTGNGFSPVTYTNSSTIIPGSGVSNVSICRSPFTCDAPDDLPSVPFKVLSNNSLEIYPPAHAPSFALNPDGSFPTSWSSHTLWIRGWGQTFTKTLFYSPPPVVTSIQTSSFVTGLPVLKSAGGEKFGVRGVGLTRVTEVLFGGVPAGFVQCGVGDADQLEPTLCPGNPGYLIVTSPPHAAGLVNVQVRSACFGNYNSNILCGLSQTSAASVVSVKDPPSLQSLNLASGLPQGGESVTLSGSGFTGPYTAVHFGDTVRYCNAGQCANMTDASLTVVAPPGAAGTSVPVWVDNPCPNESGAYCGATTQIYYRYLANPTVTALTPASGAYIGGNQVVVEGTGFATATGVLIGGNQYPVVILSDSTLSFTAPTGFPGLVATLPGTVGVSVVTACGPTAPGATSCGVSSPLPYEYRNDAALTTTALSLDPVAGPVGGHAVLRATLRTSDGVPIPGRTVSFTLRGANVGTAVTSAAGVATLTATLPALASGIYPGAAAAAFTADPVYAASSATATLTERPSEVVVWGNYVSFLQVQPPGLEGVKAVAAGYAHVLALKNDGTVVGWGRAAGANVPAGLTNVVQVATTATYADFSSIPSAALRADGSVVVWPSYLTDMQPPAGLPPLTSIAIGQTVAAGITTGGGVVAWGSGNSNYDITAVPPGATSGVVAVAAGFAHVLALKSDGTVVAWGRNDTGQTSVPPGLSNVVSIAAGAYGSLALRSDGTVVAWGSNQYGASYTPPPSVVGAQDIAFALYPVARLASGQIVTWLGQSVAPAAFVEPPPGLSIRAYALGGFDVPFIAAVVSPRLGTTLTVDAASGPIGSSTTLQATLVSGEAPVAGATIEFRLNGVLVGSAATDATGAATFPASLTGIARGSYPSGVSASFADDGTYAAATATAALDVSGQGQTIAFGPLPDKTALDPPFAVVATASSGLPVAFGATGACTIAGNTVTITGAGSCAVTASQAGDATYEPAPDVVSSFAIATAAQTIAFPTIYGRPYDSGPVTLAATASSGLPVTFSIVSGPATIAANVLTMTGIGSIVVRASQPGDSTYSAAPDVDQTFGALGLPVATVLTPSHGPLTGGMEVSLTGDGLSTTNNLLVNGVVVAATSVSNALVTFTMPPGAAGPASVQADVRCYDYAPGATACGLTAPVTFTYDKLPQSILFDALLNRADDGTPFPVSATATSSLAVSFAASGTCTAVGTTITLSATPGTCTVTATQDGDATYAAATPVVRSFEALPRPVATSLSPDHGDVAGGVEVSIAGSGLSTTSGVLVNGVAVPATWVSEALVKFILPAGVPGPVDVVAVAACGASAPGATTCGPAAPLTFTYDRKPQTIAFDPLPGRTFGDAAFALAASSDSGLPVTFSVVSGPATVAGNLLTLTGAGSVTIRASQAGDTTWLSAADVDQLFAVSKALSATAVTCPASVTYSGAAQTPCRVSVTGAGGLGLSPGAAYTNNVNAGRASASYDFAGDADHEPSSGSATFQIAKAAATVVVNGFTGTYDGGAHGATGTAMGLGGADLSASLKLGSTFTNAPGGTAPWTFTGGNNYQDQAGDASIVITKAPLTITAVPASMVYGGAFPVLAASYSGFVHGESAANLDVPVTLAASATSASGAGSYVISAGGAAGANYAIAFVNGTLTIGPATLTVTADNQSMVAGAALPVLTANYSGFVNGDTSASLDVPVTIATTATPSSAPGTYPITVSGGADANYVLVRVDGVLTVSPAGPRRTIQSVRAALASMLPTSDRQTKRRLREAIDHLDRSLDTRLWTDDAHLGVRGGRAFEEIEDSVSLLTPGRSGNPPQAAVDLTAAMRALAVEVLADATSDGAPALLIRRAERQLALGDEARDRHHLHEAIERYQTTWATLALLPRLTHHDRRDDRRRESDRREKGK